MSAIATATARESTSQETLAKADELARQAGFASVEDLLRQARGEAAAAPPGRQVRSGMRRPYMDPLDSDPKELLALSKTSPEHYPAWVKQALAKGFTLDELKWHKHAAALERLGLPTLYDARDKFAELSKQVPRRYRP